MNEKADLVIEYLLKYCKEKEYQIKQQESKDKMRFEISNGLERVNVDIYHTGAFVPGGRINYRLRKEFDALKVKIESEPEIILSEFKQKKSVSVKYNVLEQERIDKIVEAIKTEGININFESNPPSTQVYHAKIDIDGCSVVITQYTNGTLLLQGKENYVFDRICTLVEKILLPNEKDVALRFLSSDEKKMEEFITIYTPKILETAEGNIKGLLGNTLDFLEEYDKKYLIASECLALANLNLPEFSPVVMPAAKAFEGFVKKLVIKIGLFSPDHFKTKNANFSILKDKNHPNRKMLVTKEKYAGSFLDRLDNALDMTRNFVMHSDDSQVTKINTHNEAVQRLNEICKNVKEEFEYFNKAEFGGLI